MNVSKQLKVDLNEAFKLADKIIHDHKTKAWRLGKVFITKEKRNYLFLCHAYLMWVDNFVDNKGRTIDEKKKFIEKQKRLLVNLSSGNKTDINIFEEYFLYYLIQYAHSIRNSIVIDEVLNMIVTFETDIRRIENGGILSENELDKYANGQASALFRILKSFLSPRRENNCNEKNIIFPALHHICLLRDFSEDLALGYVNVSREDINKFNLNVNDLMKDNRLTDWVEYKTLHIEKMLGEEITVLKEFPLKYKFILYGLFPYIYAKIIRLKIYNFKFKDIVDKNLLKEIRIYFLSTIFSLKIFIRIFF